MLNQHWKREQKCPLLCRWKLNNPSARSYSSSWVQISLTALVGWVWNWKPFWQGVRVVQTIGRGRVTWRRDATRRNGCVRLIRRGVVDWQTGPANSLVVLAGRLGKFSAKSWLFCDFWSHFWIDFRRFFEPEKVRNFWKNNGAAPSLNKRQPHAFLSVNHGYQDTLLKAIYCASMLFWISSQPPGSHVDLQIHRLGLAIGELQRHTLKRDEVQTSWLKSSSMPSAICLIFEEQKCAYGRARLPRLIQRGWSRSSCEPPIFSCSFWFVLRECTSSSIAPPNNATTWAIFDVKILRNKLREATRQGWVFLGAKTRLAFPSWMGDRTNRYGCLLSQLTWLPDWLTKMSREFFASDGNLRWASSSGACSLLVCYLLFNQAALSR